MANELTVSARLKCTKSGMEIDTDDFGATGIQITITGTEKINNIQIVGTSEEALLLGDVATPGWIILKNLDPTNYIEYQAATGVAASQKLKAGEIAVFRCGSSAPFVKANTDACRLRYILFED